MNKPYFLKTRGGDVLDSFPERFDLKGLKGTVIILFRKNHGLRAVREGTLSFVKLTGQIYKSYVDELIEKEDPYEIVAVDLDNGVWLTIYAKSEREVLYKNPTKRNI